MASHYLAAVVGLLVVVATAPLSARADTTRRLLDLLRQRNQISEQEYQELKEEEDERWRVYWDDGLRFGSASGDYRLRLGGRVENDWAIFVPNDELDDQLADSSGTESGTEIRRARIELDGLFYRILEFQTDFDFADGDVAFKDVFLGIRKVPGVGRIMAGHFKEPFSLEQMMSGNDLTFMERATGSNVFAPDRSLGIGVQRNFGDRLLWAAGAFRESDDTATSFGDDSLYQVTSRITGLPWFAEDGRRLLHLGFAYSHKFRNGDEQRFSQRPESGLAPRLVDTGDYEIDGMDLINAEMALVVGPFSVQSEYFRAFHDMPGEDAQFDAFYAYASYILTGEHRPYANEDGVFERPLPDKSVVDGGWGAWEIAARYSRIDLEDDEIDGHELDNVTLGLNWYPERHFRVMLNYVYANRDHQGEAHIAQARLHLDW
ncbi:MAG TPA: porin [Terriglobales bacterium]|nr:porin [Terriglobales bacterium]